jgi:hypothetical protein
MSGEYEGFMPEKRPSDFEESFAYRCMVKLYKALEAKGIVVHGKGTINPTRQTQYFDTILQIYDKATIGKTLDWFIKSLNSPYHLKISSARSFCNRFLDVRSAMDRDYTTIKPSKDAFLMAKELRKYGWPNDNELPAVIHISMVNYTQFRKDLCKFRDHLTEQINKVEREIKRKERRGKNTEDLESLSWDIDHMCEFVKYCLCTRYSYPWEFIERWFMAVWDMLRDWENWNGSLMQFVFAEDTRRFYRYGCKTAQIFYNDCQLFDNLLKELKGWRERTKNAN